MKNVTGIIGVLTKISIIFNKFIEIEKLRFKNFGKMNLTQKNLYKWQKSVIMSG